ncbi:flagellar biosynthesis/type III secretory pathway chaperone [Pseudomonas alcaligenes]|uniref:Flagellar biosynthesis/type III secretory pathway chaperone n=1 Tax=Aquipseudomonas alcaligenes TaxID=43263 RepID=A0ABR7RYC5_AQUAC|nr:flagellar export chaperone FlgN [Pseudomonas alcaligenes]MBC9249834.1 flagellar biosynthesis/type III secretory pathway chaperone [Pseudomonas alcaligenes]
MERRDQLLAVVERDIQHDCTDYLSLRGLMQELYSHLMSRDCPRIDLINHQVEGLVEAIRQRAERRSKALGAFRLEMDGEGMQCLLDSYPPARRNALQQNWQQLGQLAGQCQRLNERNGQLLAMHHDILSQLLAAQSDGGLYVQH